MPQPHQSTTRKLVSTIFSRLGFGRRQPAPSDQDMYLDFEPDLEYAIRDKRRGDYSESSTWDEEISMRCVCIIFYYFQPVLTPLSPATATNPLSPSPSRSPRRRYR
jgi:hypothetical protein